MIIENELTYEEFKKLIESLNWKMPSKKLIEKGLENSKTSKYVIANETVGMARLISDNGYIALLADVVVNPKYQGKGIGKQLVNNLLEQVKRELTEEDFVMIQLLASKGNSPFYEKLGFKIRDDIVDDGMYMWLSKK